MASLKKAILGVSLIFNLQLSSVESSCELAVTSLFMAKVKGKQAQGKRLSRFERTLLDYVIKQEVDLKAAQLGQKIAVAKQAELEQQAKNEKAKKTAKEKFAKQANAGKRPKGWCARY